MNYLERDLSTEGNGKSKIGFIMSLRLNNTLLRVVILRSTTTYNLGEQRSSKDGERMEEKELYDNALSQESEDEEEAIVRTETSLSAAETIQERYNLPSMTMNASLRDQQGSMSPTLPSKIPRKDLDTVSSLFFFQFPIVSANMAFLSP